MVERFADDVSRLRLPTRSRRDHIDARATAVVDAVEPGMFRPGSASADQIDVG